MRYRPLFAVAAGAALLLVFWLVSSGRINPRPPACYAMTQGPSLDWENIESDAELEACLSTMAKNLESPQNMADWLTSQGFYAMLPSNGEGEIRSEIYASWILQKNMALRPYGTWAEKSTWKALIFLSSLLPYPADRFLFPRVPFAISVSYYLDGRVKVFMHHLYL